MIYLSDEEDEEGWSGRLMMARMILMMIFYLDLDEDP